MLLSTLNSELDWSISSNKTQDQNNNPYQHDHHHDTNATNNIPTASIKQAFSMSNWIIWNNPKPPAQTIEQSSTNNKKPKATQKHHIQQPLQASKDNKHWGDNPTPAHNIFQVLACNVNSISQTDQFLQWQGIAVAMKLYNINAICLQETNIKWDDKLHDQVRQAIQKMHPQVLLSTSSSTEPTDSEANYNWEGQQSS